MLAVLLLNASEFQVGVLGAAGVAAFLVVGLPAGAWIDRMRKRHVMIWADAVRAVALAALPLLWWLGRSADVAPLRRRARSSASRRSSSTCRTRASSRRSCARIRSPRRTASSSRRTSWPTSPARRSAAGSSASSPRRSRSSTTVGTYVDLVRRAAVHARPREAARRRRTARRSCTRSGRACASSSPSGCCDGSSARPEPRTSSTRSR